MSSITQQPTRPGVAIVVGDVAMYETRGKLLFLAKVLEKAGLDTHVLCWGAETAHVAGEKGLAVVRLQLDGKQWFDKIAEAKNVMGLLDWPISQGRDAPTWGRLMALDDFIGAAQFWELKGAESWRPACVVMPIPGAEAGCPEDEHMYLSVVRYCQRNRVPLVGVEIQRLDHSLAITRWPCDAYLCKSLDHKNYPPSHLLRPAHRYYLGVLQDSAIEMFLEQEDVLRKKALLEPGEKFVLVPFHIYYIHEFGMAVRQVAEAVKDVPGVGVIVTCGESWRRGLTEKDLVGKGCRRYWQGLNRLRVIERADILALSLAAECTVMSFPLAPMEEVASKWGTRVVRAWQGERLEAGMIGGLVEPGEVINELLRGFPMRSTL